MFIFVKFRFFNETISPKLRLYRYWWIERCRSLHPPEGERRGWRRLPRFYFPLVFSNFSESRIAGHLPANTQKRFEPEASSQKPAAFSVVPFFKLLRLSQ